MKASKGEAESDVSGVQVSMLSRSSDKSEKLQSFKLHTSNGAGIPRGTRSEYRGGYRVSLLYTGAHGRTRCVKIGWLKFRLDR